MKHVKYTNYHKVASYCKSEGLNTDYFITSNKILVNKMPWFKNTDK